MKSEFTAIIEPAPEGGFWAICPEVPGANGQGESVEEAKNNLQEALELFFECASEEEIVRCQKNEIYVGRVEIAIE